MVARAAAQVALKALANLGLGRVGVFTEEVNGGHDHARSAIAALQAVTFLEGCLDRMPVVFTFGQSLDGQDGVAISLDSENAAGLDALAIEQDGARTAI